MAIGQLGVFGDLIQTIVEAGTGIYNESKEIILEANHENAIFTEQSKTKQKNSDICSGYSRVAGFAPKDELILSPNTQSYAEYITVLNDSNYKSRLTQYCEFDICKRSSAFENFEYETESGKRKAFVFSKERILFDNNTVKELQFNSDGTAYTLPHGIDTLVFRPKLSSIYTFSVVDNDNARISLFDDTQKVLFDSQQVKAVYLEGGKTYIIHTTLLNGAYGSYKIRATVDTLDIDSPKINVTVPRLGQIYRLNVSETKGYYVSSTNESIEFNLFDGGMNLLESSNKDSYAFYLQKEKNYYIQILSNTASEQITTLYLNEVQAVTENKTYQITDVGITKMFSFTSSSNVDTYYTIAFSGFSGLLSAEIFGNSNAPIIASATGLYTLNLFLTPGEQIYIRVKSESLVDLKVNKADTDYKWIVDGKEISNNTICLRRGSTTLIQLGINGIVTDAPIYSLDGNFTLSNYKLELPKDRALTNPLYPETYLKLFAFSKETPFALNVCVTHDFETFQFGSFYYEETKKSEMKYGITWKMISSNDTDAIKINYIIYNDKGISKNEVHSTNYEDLCRDSVLTSPEVSIRDNVLKDGLSYTWYKDLYVEITSLDFYKKEYDNETKQNVYTSHVKIYNTNGATYKNLTDERAKYQIFTLDRVRVNPCCGYGTRGEPYRIRTGQQFKDINKFYRLVYKNGYSENQIDYCFKLMNDIKISGDWTPFTYKFAGDFNGAGHYISYNMNIIQTDINTSVYQGLFGFVVSGGKIHDLELKDCTIKSDTSTTLSRSDNQAVDIGIVAGSFYEASSLTNVTVTNPKIECKISEAAIGAIAGSFYHTSATNCVVQKQGDGTPSITNNTRGYIGGMAGLGTSISQFSGCKVTISLKNTDFNKEKKDKMGEVISTDSMSVEDYKTKYGITVEVSMDKGSCLAAGSLITLANGDMVPVETLTGNEMLLVWDLKTGSFDSAPILFVDVDSAQEYEIVNLSFSDGTNVKVISEHGFWDFDLNKYVYLDRNAAQYLGHFFNKQTTDENGDMVWSKVQLVGVELTTEYTAAYSPVTYSHLCYYVNGMLSMPGGIDGLFNIFEVDGETMKYDETKMQADIEKYGLFTYEEFVELVPVTEEVFNAFNGEYLKVAIGKGLIGVSDLNALATRYARFF